jgi:hypothetical protein
MKTTCYRLKIIFLTPVLGSQPTRDVATQYLAKKSGFEIPQDELEMLPDVLERGTTVFHKDSTEQPVLMSYHVLGFLKESARVQNGKVDGEVKALRSKVERTVFVSPRTLPLVVPAGVGIDYLERPLRAETAMGPRVALARSEMLPEGTWFAANLEVLDGQISQAVLTDLLDYGYYRGLGLWRNSGIYGTFRYELQRES